MRWAKRHQHLLRHLAAAAYPRECCGFLIGIEEAAGWRLQEVWPASNISRSPAKGFELDGREHAAAMRHADAQQILLIGYYHSHPNGRRGPSLSDFILAGGDPAFLLPHERAALPADVQNSARHRLPDHSLHLIVAVEHGQPVEIDAWQMRRDLSGFDRIDLEFLEEPI